MPFLSQDYKPREELDESQIRYRNINHENARKTILLLRSVENDREIYDKVKSVMEGRLRASQFWIYYNTQSDPSIQPKRTDKNKKAFLTRFSFLTSINSYWIDQLNPSQIATITAIRRALEGLAFREDDVSPPPPPEQTEMTYTIRNLARGGQLIFLNLSTTFDNSIDFMEDQDLEEHMEEAKDLIDQFKRMLQPKRPCKLRTCFHFARVDHSTNTIVDWGYLNQHTDSRGQNVVLPPRAREFVSKFREILNMNKLAYELMASATDYIVFQYIELTVQYTVNTREFSEENLYMLIKPSMRTRSNLYPSDNYLR